MAFMRRWVLGGLCALLLLSTATASDAKVNSNNDDDDGTPNTANNDAENVWALVVAGYRIKRSVLYSMLTLAVTSFGVKPEHVIIASTAEQIKEAALLAPLGRDFAAPVRVPAANIHATLAVCDLLNIALGAADKLTPQHTGKTVIPTTATHIYVLIAAHGLHALGKGEQNTVTEYLTDAVISLKEWSHEFTQCPTDHAADLFGEAYHRQRKANLRTQMNTGKVGTEGARKLARYVDTPALTGEHIRYLSTQLSARRPSPRQYFFIGSCYSGAMFNHKVQRVDAPSWGGPTSDKRTITQHGMTYNVNDLLAALTQAHSDTDASKQTDAHPPPVTDDSSPSSSGGSADTLEHAKRVLAQVYGGDMKRLRDAADKQRQLDASKNSVYQAPPLPNALIFAGASDISICSVNYFRYLEDVLHRLRQETWRAVLPDVKLAVSGMQKNEQGVRKKLVAAVSGQRLDTAKSTGVAFRFHVFGDVAMLDTPCVRPAPYTVHSLDNDLLFLHRTFTSTIPSKHISALEKMTVAALTKRSAAPRPHMIWRAQLLTLQLNPLRTDEDMRMYMLHSVQMYAAAGLAAAV